MAPLGCRLALLLPPRNTCRLAAAGTRTPPRHGVPAHDPEQCSVIGVGAPCWTWHPGPTLSAIFGPSEPEPSRRRHTFFTSDLRQIRSR